MNKRTLQAISLCGLLVTATITPVFAETTYAIVIGINDYQHVNKLSGAVNDANDIHNTLKKMGIRNVKKLINHEASYSNIKKAWQQAVSRAKPNDRIIFTYAGHGISLRDKNGDEALRDPADFLDEAYILSQYKPGGSEIIVDDEMSQWIREATQKQINVLVIADSCHSGDGFRSFKKSRNRGAPISLDTSPPLRDSIIAPPLQEEDFSGRLMYISATSPLKTVEEMELASGWRGALSLAFTKALSNADRNRDGGISVDEIKGYIQSEVMLKTNKKQSPQFQPLGGSNFVFRSPVQKPPAPTANPNNDKIKLKITGKTPTFLRNLPDIALSNRGYDFHWNSGNGKLYNSTNDLVAEQINGQTGLSKVVGRHKLIKSIYELAKVPNRFVKGTLGTTETKTHKLNQQVRFNLSNVSQPHFYQFNIAGNGTIQCFPKVTGGTREYDFKTMYPVGNDTLVSIALPHNNNALSQLISSNGYCNNDPAQLAKLLPQALNGQAYQINHVDIYVEN